MVECAEIIDITKYAGKNYTVQFYAKSDSSITSAIGSLTMRSSFNEFNGPQ